MSANGLPFEQLVVWLSSEIGSNVVNQTGLAGNFDWDLTYTPDPLRGHAPDRFTSVDPDGPSVFTAVRDQLGLRLIAIIRVN